MKANGDLTFLEWLKMWKFIRKKDYDEMEEIEQNILWDDYEKFIKWQHDCEM